MPAADDTATGFRRFLCAGDSGVVVSFADEADADIAMLKARRLAEIIRGKHKPGQGILDVIPGFNNVTIQYDPLEISSSTIIAATAPLIGKIKPAPATAQRQWRIPVHYGDASGPDLDEVAKRTGFAPDEVISRHLARTLTVALMGFMPGLGYLKGVDPALFLPRRRNPRISVPALSLGIAMDQSVIYPQTSPGGWNLIGRVPVRIFDKRKDDPILFRPGDMVCFRRVGQKEFADLDARAAAGEDIIAPEKPVAKGVAE